MQNGNSVSKLWGFDPGNSFGIDPSSSIEYQPWNNPLGVTLAPTGMIPVKPGQKGNVQTPNVPIDPSEIIEDTIACYEMGVGAVHLHARNPDGTPTQNPEYFIEIIEGIRKYCHGIIIGVTTSGRCNPFLESRAKVLEIPYVDLASITVNSIQFPEKTVIAEEKTIIALLEIMDQNSIKPEFEFFDSGGINIVKKLQKRGILQDKAIYCNLLVGNVATSQADLSEISRSINLLPLGTYCGIAGIGPFQLKANTAAIMIGGMAHIRIGLEDNIYKDRLKTELATNQSLVKRVVQIANLFERPIATSEQMREMIGLRATE